MNNNDSNIMKNVCAYCRVSSNKDEQENSLKEQIAYYSDLIMNNPNWKFAGIFADDGISGTTIIQRKQFKLMISKAKAGLIDIIITKSISRFARNVVNLLETIHELRTIGVEVIFERENFSSLDTKSDMMLTIYAKFAEEESESISKNVKWRNRINVQNGQYHLPNNLFGYSTNSNKEPIIIEEQAYWVRKMYKLYLDKVPVHQIVKMLEENNVLTSTGKTKWNPTTIRSILKNEKYVGDCLMQKEFMDNTLSHKKIKNRGELPQAYIKNGHPPIVDRKTWDDVQVMIKKRNQKFKSNCNISTFKPFSIWSSFVVCPYCKRNFNLRTSSSTGRKILVDASNRDVLTCFESQSIYTDVLEKIIKEQISILQHNISEFKTSLSQALPTMSTSQEEQEIKNKINELQTKLMSLKQTNNEATIILKDKYKNKINDLYKQLMLMQTQECLENSENLNPDFLVSAIKEIDVNQSIENIDFKSIFKKVLAFNRNKLVFIIGNGSINSINKKTKTMFNGKLSYKERATIFTAEFGIVIRM